MDLSRKEGSVVLAILTAIALWFCFEMVQPFLRALFSAAFIAIAFYPLHEFVKRHVPGESRPALISTLVVILVVIVPTILLVGVVIDQGQSAYQHLAAFLTSGGMEKILNWIRSSPLGRFELPIQSVEDIEAWLRSNAERLSSMSLAVVRNVAGNLTALIGNLLMTTFILFFCFRDGAWNFRQLAAMTPLTMEQVNRLTNTVHGTMRASVYGIVAVGLAQGALTAIVFTALGLPSPIFWGVFAGFASLLPPFGASLVWLPASIALMVTGHMVKGLVLFGLGAGVISTSDNIIRPLVIQGRIAMGTLMVLISILGGIQAFGLIGLFAGPVIFSLAAELLKLLRENVSTRSS